MQWLSDPGCFGFPALPSYKSSMIPAAGRGVLGEFMPTFLWFTPCVVDVTSNFSPLTKTNHMSLPNNKGIKNGVELIEYFEALFPVIFIISKERFEWLGRGPFSKEHLHWPEFLLESSRWPSFLCWVDFWLTCAHPAPSSPKEYSPSSMSAGSPITFSTNHGTRVKLHPWNMYPLLSCHYSINKSL